ncbi:hypothetical protein FBU30_004459 [Linnemannia zychae]|nr:hypothetical protein FBU30_004459 [Linnemannia zychae]
MEYNDIGVSLCPSHETYLRGHVFRRRFPDYQTTALQFGVNTSETIEATGESQDEERASQSDGDDDTDGVNGNGSTQDIHFYDKGEDKVVFTGAQLDELTQGLHPEIKNNIINLIKEYFLFLEGPSERLIDLEKSTSRFSVRYRLKKKPNSLAIMVGFTTNLSFRLHKLMNCNTDQQAHATFPYTKPNMARSPDAIIYCELLADIVHELLVAHQYDVWCPCQNKSLGVTHTQVYWFHGDKTQPAFKDVMNSLGPIINKWVEAFRNL